MKVEVNEHRNIPALSYFVDSARVCQAKDKQDTASFIEGLAATAMDSVDQHDKWFQGVNSKLVELLHTAPGKEPIAATDIPGLGKFWTPAAVATELSSLAHLGDKVNKEVVKEISLGLAEQMKKLNAFVEALFQLSSTQFCEGFGEQMKTRGSNPKLNFMTSDGYHFSQFVGGNYNKLGVDSGGVDLYLGGSLAQEAQMSTPNHDTWAKYIQPAEVTQTSWSRYGAPLSEAHRAALKPNPGGWKAGSEIATLALSSSSNTSLMELGQRIDGSTAVKASVKNGDKDLLIHDSSVVDPVLHSLYNSDHPLFKKAAIKAA